MVPLASAITRSVLESKAMSASRGPVISAATRTRSELNALDCTVIRHSRKSQGGLGISPGLGFRSASRHGRVWRAVLVLVLVNTIGTGSDLQVDVWIAHFIALRPIANDEENGVLIGAI